jgi:hypothetical protein
LFENQCPIREDPTAINGSANDLPGDRFTVVIAQVAPPALFFRIDGNS